VLSWSLLLHGCPPCGNVSPAATHAPHASAELPSISSGRLAALGSSEVSIESYASHPLLHLLTHPDPAPVSQTTSCLLQSSRCHRQHPFMWRAATCASRTLVRSLPLTLVDAGRHVCLELHK